MLGLKDFLDVFDETATDVQVSSYTTVQTNLDRWFESIEEDESAAKIEKWLTDRVDFDQWYEERRRTVGGMVGSGELTWPRDKLQRLGAQITLFRKCQANVQEYLDFDSHFFGISSNFDGKVSTINGQVFMPMYRDLRRYIINEYENADELEMIAPATDRVVSLNHNSQPYKDAIQALDDVVRAVKESNEYNDVKDRDRRLAELAAGKTLLEAETASPRKIVTVLGETLKWLAGLSFGALVTQAATQAWPLIEALLKNFF